MARKSNKFGLTNYRSPNNFYADSIQTINAWFNKNQELSEKINEYIAKRMEQSLPMQELTVITNYQLEYTKIMYSCMALLDKLIRTQERLENEETEV